MFRAICVKPNRLVRGFNSRNLSSVNKGKPELASTTVKSVSVAKPSPVHPLVLLLVTTAAAGSIALVLNADNKDLVAQLDKHAPFLNTVLKPFRPPAAKVEKTSAKIDVVPEVVTFIEEQHHDDLANVIDIVEEKPVVETVATLDSNNNHTEEVTQLQSVIEQSVEQSEIVHEHPHSHESTFSAHEEVHELEVKYEEALHPEHKVVVESPTASSSSSSLPNEVNSSLLHHELQTQAKAILSELQNEMHRQHQRDLEIRYSHDLKEALREQAAELDSKRKHDLEAQATQIVTELQQELNHTVALLRQKQVEHLLELQPKVEDLQAQLKTFQEVAAETASAVKQTVDSHQVSSAVLALELALSSHHGHNASLFVKELQKSCKNDELVMAVLKSLPEHVLREGALSHSELQVRFNIMRNEVRKVALAPEEAPKMVGQAIGTFLAWVTWVPKGHITGNGVEDALARADHHLERGRVREALAELDEVQGYSQVLMSDFKQLAQDRLVVDQSIAVLKAKSILRHRAFV